jgi:DNA primase
VLLFPDGDDPDSYSKKVTNDEFKAFIKSNSKDFVLFKTQLLYEETKGDPIKLSNIIKDVVESLALIPHTLDRVAYIKECSKIIGGTDSTRTEQIIIIEINKAIRKKGNKNNTNISNFPLDEAPPEDQFVEDGQIKDIVLDNEEKDLLQLMMQYGNVLVDVEAEDTDNVQQSFQLTVCEFIIFELWRDQLQFINPIYQMVLDECQHYLEQEVIPTTHTFLNHQNPVISQFALNIASLTDVVSPGWEKFGIDVPLEIHSLKKGIEHRLFSLKDKRLNSIIISAKENLKTADPFENQDVFKNLIQLESQKKRVNKILGRTIIK